jgi:predicted RNase H-like nuclease
MPNEASALRFGHTRNDFGSSGEHSMFVAGVDGCRAGSVAFEVEVPSITTSVEVVNLRHGCENARLISPASASTSRMVEGRRACDKAARKLLGQQRGSSVFPAPCRPAWGAQTYAEASSINRQKTTGAEPASMGHRAQDQAGG